MLLHRSTRGIRDSTPNSRRLFAKVWDNAWHLQVQKVVIRLVESDKQVNKRCVFGSQASILSSLHIVRRMLIKCPGHSNWTDE